MTCRPASRLADIEPFHVVELLTRARQLEAEGRDIIHMEIGEPDFPTPEPIVTAAVNAIKAGKTHYTQARDLLETVGVAATPGLDFGGNAPERHLRFAYTTGIERLAEAVDRLARYFRSRP